MLKYKIKDLPMKHLSFDDQNNKDNSFATGFYFLFLKNKLARPTLPFYI
jgi:hypothetical protein